jgi:hypothetical protein
MVNHGSAEQCPNNYCGAAPYINFDTGKVEERPLTRDPDSGWLGYYANPFGPSGEGKPEGATAQDSWVYSNNSCSITVKFSGKLSSGTPSFATGPNHRKLGKYTGNHRGTGYKHNGFRFEVTGSVASGGIGRIGDPGASTSIAIPGGGQWTIGQWKYPWPTNSRNGVSGPENGKTTDDSPRYFDRSFGSDVNVAVHGNTFAWHDEPGMSEDAENPLKSGSQKTNFVVYATNGKEWCGIYFNIQSTFANGKWYSTIQFGQLQ